MDYTAATIHPTALPVELLTDAAPLPPPPAGPAPGRSIDAAGATTDFPGLRAVAARHRHYAVAGVLVGAAIPAGVLAMLAAVI